MKEITNKQFFNLFYINAENITSRVQMADIWESVRPSNSDVILKTKKGFLLKSDTPKTILSNTLKNLQNHKKITAYVETSPYKTTHSQESLNPNNSYSCIIASVDMDITDNQMSKFLTDQEVSHRYCKRIVAKSNNKPTHMLRIITSHLKAYEKLVQEGVFYKNRHYAVYPSLPPPPAPLPCSKCLEFTHRTEECKTSPKCSKCGENHSTIKCKSVLPPKCNSCGSEDHQAWSFKCPNRPRKPIEGIPNIPVKTLNKKTHEINGETRKKSRIHSPVTIHDVIVNTFVNKLNKPKHVNRAELLEKLRRKFIQEYQIETSVTFVGNKIYILMFDMLLNDFNSPTEPLHGRQDVQVHSNA